MPEPAACRCSSTTICPARSDAVDEYHKDGIAAGFLCYPLEGFTGEERSKAILDFRDDLRDAILRDAGAEAVTFLGGATGCTMGIWISLPGICPPY